MSRCFIVIAERVLCRGVFGESVNKKTRLGDRQVFVGVRGFEPPASTSRT